MKLLSFLTEYEVLKKIRSICRMISNECCHWGYISDLVSLCSIFYVKIMCDRAISYFMLSGIC